MIFYIISYHIAIYRPFQQNVTRMRYDIWCMIYMTDIKFNIGLYQVIHEIYRPIPGGICDTPIRYVEYIIRNSMTIVLSRLCILYLLDAYLVRIMYVCILCTVTKYACLLSLQPSGF